MDMEGSGGQKDNQIAENISKTPKEFGRLDLKETPYKADVKTLAHQHFPGSKYLKTTTGEEYILDGTTNRTIMIFERPTEQGFTSIYSPLAPQELRQKLSSLPEEQQEELAKLLRIQSADIKSQSKENGHGEATDKLLGTIHSEEMPISSKIGVLAGLQQPTSDAIPAQSEAPTLKKDLPPSDLPESHFLKLTPEEYSEQRKQQWETVKDLDDNDPRKILYFRRFTDEFRSQVSFNPELTHTPEDPYKYYAIDSSKMGELPTVEPHKSKIDLPKGTKIGFVIGYHHLEKPWSHIFMNMFQKQMKYDPNQIEFIVIQNTDIPTRDSSPASNAEISKAVAEHGITHIIDMHEQFIHSLNHYIDDGFELQFKQPGEKTNCQAKGEVVFDPFIPTWMIEQYYQGRVYPQLQYAINDQLKKVEALTKKL